MMAYANSYVACICAEGTTLREFNKDNLRHVHLPYGTEYGIFLRNKSPQRCAVRISIDGTDVLCAKQLILSAGQSLTLERFVESLSAGQKFRFVSKETAQLNGTIQDPDSPHNGIVRVEFYREAPPIIVNGLSRTGWYVDATPLSSATPGVSVNSTATMDWHMEPQSASYRCANSTPSGVTEQGSVSTQAFTTTTTFSAESDTPTEVITFRLCAPEKSYSPPKQHTATLIPCPSPHERRPDFVCATCNNKGSVWFLSSADEYKVVKVNQY